MAGRLPLLLNGLDPGRLRWPPEGGFPRTNLVEADPHLASVRVGSFPNIIMDL